METCVVTFPDLVYRFFLQAARNGDARPPHPANIARDLKVPRVEVRKAINDLKWQGKLTSKLTSALDEIEGIGPGRRKALLQHFGSLSAVREASIGELEAVPGIPRSVARKVWSRFNEAPQ